MFTDPSRKYSGHTVPNPQAHAVSHSVAQGDQRQFFNWPNNSSFTLRFLYSSPVPVRLSNLRLYRFSKGDVQDSQMCPAKF